MPKFNNSGFASSLLVLMLLVLGIGAATYLTQQHTQLTPKADETADIEQLTNQLIQSGLGLRPEQQSRPDSNLEKISFQRKQLLLKEAEVNPAKFLEHARLAQQRSKFPASIAQNIEEESEITGALQVLHADNFDQKKSYYQYALIDSTSEEQDELLAKPRYDLYFVTNPPKVYSGSIVTVKSVKLASKLVTETGDPSGRKYNTKVKTPKPAISTGRQKVAVFLINFSGNKVQPFTVDQVKGLVLSNPASVRNFYREISYDKVNVTADVLGWFTVTPKTPECEFGDWGNQAKQQAKNLKGYNRFIYVMTYSPMDTGKCNWGGLGTIGGNPASEAWVFGYDSYISDSTFNHEFGHNLGVHHANFFSCGDKSVDEYYRCQNNEYGDPYDVMGNGFNHFNAPHKLTVGWLSDNDIQKVSQDGVYELVPIESSGKKVGKRVLKIAKLNSDDDYYLEYRQPVGFDKTLSSDLLTGVSIRFSNLSAFIQTKLVNPQPQRLSSPNPTSTPGPPPSGPVKGGFNYVYDLMDGEQFDDQINDITIKQISHSPTGVKVEVKFGPNPYLGPAAPEFQFSNSYCNFDKPVVNLSWTRSVKAVKYELYRDQQIIALVDQPDISINPYYSDNDLSLEQNHSYSYQLKAVDSSGRKSSPSDILSVETPDCKSTGKSPPPSPDSSSAPSQIPSPRQ